MWLVIVAVLAAEPDWWLRGDAFLGLLRAEVDGSGPVLSGAPVDVWWEVWRGNAEVRSWPQGTTLGMAAAAALLVAAAGEVLARRRVMLAGIVGLGLVALELLAASVAFGGGAELAMGGLLALIAAVTVWRLPPRPAPRA